MNIKQTDEKIETQKQQLAIQKIYVKEASFLSNNAPNTFKKEWKPEVKFNLENKTQKLDDGNYDIDLTVTYTVYLDKEEICQGKVTQSGIFTLTGFPTEQLDYMVTSYCPNILYPFIRETIADASVRGGYPQLLISPMNFDSIYTQLQEERKKQTETKETKH